MQPPSTPHTPACSTHVTPHCVDAMHVPDRYRQPSVGGATISAEISDDWRSRAIRSCRASVLWGIRCLALVTHSDASLAAANTPHRAEGRMLRAGHARHHE